MNKVSQQTFPILSTLYYMDFFILVKEKLYTDFEDEVEKDHFNQLRW